MRGYKECDYNIKKWKSAGYVRVLDMFKGSGMVVKPQWIPDDYKECYNGIRDDGVCRNKNAVASKSNCIFSQF